MTIRSSKYTKKKRALGLVAGTCLVAIAPFVAGCSDDKNDSEKAAASDITPTADPAENVPREPDSSKGSSKAPPGAGKQQQGPAGASSAQEAVTRWVSAVVQDRPEEACKVMAMPAEGSSDEAKPKAMGKCGDNEAETRKTKKQLSRFHTTFTPDKVSNPPQVNVAEPKGSGDKAAVDGDHIAVDGQTLNAIVLSHSTGVKKGQVDVNVKTSRVDNSWYVTDLGLSVG
ncbi:hypothetical protein [Streptomyces axinellae]|uniref:Lipoprotein n=1 Tax=Streptomyces axinellae TaxID=552788 RepID=A0ABN3PY81_9ACTN